MRTQLLAATLVRGTVVFTTTLAAVGPLAGSRRNHVTLASWLLRWARGLLVMLLDGFVMVDTAAADTLVINDLTDSLSVQGATSREVIQIIPPGSTLEGVSIVISAPAPGVTIAGRTIPDTAFLGVAEPDGITFSDAITMRPGSVGTTEAVVSFFSDVEPPPPFQLCTEVIGPCTLVENGAVQTAGTITWSDGTVDTILFCSDVEGVPSTCSTTQVPEPASLVLLGTGLAALMGFVRLESEIRRCSGRRTVGLHSWRTGQHGTTSFRD